MFPKTIQRVAIKISPKCKILLFEGDGQLVFEGAFEEREVLFMSVLLSEGDSGGAFGRGGSVTRAVGTGLDDMHHAGFGGVTADIERICSHQNASHRINTRVKLYLCHSRELSSYMYQNSVLVGSTRMLSLSDPQTAFGFGLRLG